MKMSCERGGRSDAADFSRPSVNQSVSQFAAHALLCSVSSTAGRHWIHLVPIFLLPIFSGCLLLSPAGASLSPSHSNARQVRAHGSRLFHVPRNLCFLLQLSVCLFCLFVFFLGFCRKSVSTEQRGKESIDSYCCCHFGKKDHHRFVDF
jgi:hypothetical protein